MANDTSDLASESVDGELFVRVVALQDAADTANRPSVLVLSVGTLEMEGLRAARVAIALSKVDRHAQAKSSTTSKEVHERWRLRDVEALDGQDRGSGHGWDGHDVREALGAQRGGGEDCGGSDDSVSLFAICVERETIFF